ncbi:hypothetical protein KFL_006340110 [Klebsormidium nitens]|uniref:Uncharacterized protein n=1 Tax=Klebsormidium nitens TaxID=105231 RepID=A0A1Y1IJS2_KLENI|nr:hypothetical protein KFL_006340110 [Klebsormidium nitens]|eukprot:GAQ90392.1 hypothetical protein KFL_006340110 [Klebsormidium nitens]
MALSKNRLYKPRETLKALQLSRKAYLEMDEAAVARFANLAKYGDNNEKEARGLQILSRAIQKDGRLEFHKSFEKARADCCVYMPGALALGIQLKTTGVTGVDGRNGTNFYSFKHTNGYTGLLLVFIAVHVQPPRIWLAEGSKLVSQCVQIPVTRVRYSINPDRLQEVDFANLASAIHKIYEEALTGSSNYVLRSPTEHEKPTAPTALAEYEAFKRLQRSLSVTFVDPPAEHMSYDYLVEGKRWQLKLARYDVKKDQYKVGARVKLVVKFGCIALVMKQHRHRWFQWPLDGKRRSQNVPVMA